jgi:hypothetical protein
MSNALRKKAAQFFSKEMTPKEMECMIGYSTITEEEMDSGRLATAMTNRLSHKADTIATNDLEAWTRFIKWLATEALLAQIKQ